MTINPLLSMALGAAGTMAASFGAQLAQGQDFFALFKADDGEAAANVEATDTPSAGATTSVEAKLNKLHDLILQRLEDAGLRTNYAVELSLDAGGQLQIGGDHPEMEKVKTLLAGDAEVAAAYRDWASAAQQASTVQQQVAFAEAYARDPFTAAQLTAPTSSAAPALRVVGDYVEVIQ